MSERPLLVIFDDRIARDWQPLALTRPIGELFFGCVTQRERAERALGLPLAGYLGCPELAGFEEPGSGRVLTEPPPRSVARLFLCSRALPAWGATLDYAAEPASVLVAGKLLGWYAPPGTPEPPPEFFGSLSADLAPRARLALPGGSVEAVWELIDRNPAQVIEDFRGLAMGGQQHELPGYCHAIGSPSGWLRMGSRVTIEPGVVLDFTAGPIWLADDVTIRAFTRLAGPAYIGPGSTVLGGALSAVSIGPGCKVHGELEGSVLLGYGNKAHDGYLGHAYLGRWVNIGAETVNSNLKNNYGPVRMWTPSGVADTGIMKLGCILGDHVKTAIGTLFSTGTVVGAGSSLFGSRQPSQYVPPFSWGTGAEQTVYDPERFLAAAATAMARRDVQLSDGMRSMLRRAWERSRGEAAR